MKVTPTRAIIDESKVILHNVGVSSVKTSLKERSLEFFSGFFLCKFCNCNFTVRIISLPYIYLQFKYELIHILYVIKVPWFQKDSFLKGSFHRVDFWGGKDANLNFAMGACVENCFLGGFCNNPSIGGVRIKNGMALGVSCFPCWTW